MASFKKGAAWMSLWVDRLLLSVFYNENHQRSIRFGLPFQSADAQKKEKYRKVMINMKKILFINSSPEKSGVTATYAANLLEGLPYETITLADYRINSYGSTLPEDQFNEILARIRGCDILVLGSPLLNIYNYLIFLLDSYRYLPPSSLNLLRSCIKVTLPINLA